MPPVQNIPIFEFLLNFLKYLEKSLKLFNFKGKIDLAISNPPYIPKDTYEK